MERFSLDVKGARGAFGQTGAACGLMLLSALYLLSGAWIPAGARWAARAKHRRELRYASPPVGPGLHDARRRYQAPRLPAASASRAAGSPARL